MNIEEFVKESLSQILKGVSEIREMAKDTGALINPKAIGHHTTTDNWGHGIQNIEFDVAVTVSEAGDVKSGISVMGLGVKAGLAESSSTVSRIKFNVPVSLPSTETASRE